MNKLLINASRFGEMNLIMEALKRGTEIEYKNSALSVACSIGYLEIVKYLIEHGAVMSHYTFLLLFSKGHLEIIEYFLEQPDYVDFHKTEAGAEALYEASMSCQLKTVRYLIERGVDIHAHNDLALRLASQHGHCEVVKYLIEKGANIHAEYDASLRSASGNGNLKIVELLLEHGANIHAGDDNALVRASEEGHLEIVKLLLEHGTNINASSLTWASGNGHYEVVKLLVESGADIHYNGNIALQWAVEVESLKIVKYLVKHGANVTAPILKIALKNRCFQILNFLKRHIDNTLKEDAI